MLRFIRNARFFWILLLAGASFAIPAHAQEPISEPPQQQGPPEAVPPIDRSEQQVLRKMAQERNVARQKELVAEANKLLELAKKLKAEVEKSNKDQLSLSVVDTAGEMEKLAKSVKDKMRDGN
jgi:hypothetical protein